jgi:hypothetical protein
MDGNALVQNATALIAVGWKIAGAVGVCLLGRWLIASP